MLAMVVLDGVECDEDRGRPHRTAHRSVPPCAQQGPELPGCGLQILRPALARGRHLLFHRDRSSCTALEMDDLIFSINNIQDQFKALSQKPADLPQIVVVGSQSSGKSSVLESIVRRSFLPRGSGIVTRCPLILRLTNCPLGDSRREDKLFPDFNDCDETSKWEEWGEFDDEKKPFGISEIQNEIQRRTAKLAGGNKNISSQPIVLKIFSPNVLTLTLVDLPGITKVAVGDQPEDIEDQIVDLINKFIENPKSIILAVIPANTDMAANDCLKMAKRVDPEGERTLAVVTKLDLMDRGTNAIDILTGLCIPVKLGIIGVVNRAQEDINKGKSVEDAMRDEENFLREKYPDLADKNGSAHLAKMLQTLLIRHIKTCLPDVKASFLKRLEECRSIIDQCGTKITDERAYLHNMIGAFSSDFQDMMSGGFVDLESVYLELTRVDVYKKYGNEQVILAIRQTSGPEPPLIFSERAFEALMRPLIKTMRLPSLLCIQNVAEELREVCEKCLPKEKFGRFPKAIQEMSTVVDEMIDKFSELTQELVTQTIDFEEGHISHSHFLNFRNESLKDILKMEEKDSSKLVMPFKGESNLKCKGDVRDFEILAPTVQDVKHVMIIGEMLKIYYAVVANRVQDTVVKATMTYLVNGLQKNVQLELATQLGHMLQGLFKEDPSVALRRSQKEKEFTALRNSLKELDILDYIMANRMEL
ncbi:Dynamin-1-like protein [Frankliniella fusca]|uniref:Dynamin-1-like protein n=1 Tax=Frankliniella fusca TaxID=407009 RepID=A0AAE1LRF3_9NEOP|nr:Dynamin-1-like protein [Frankliniella fusca]